MEQKINRKIFFSYSENQVRVFNCNEIFLENLNGVDLVVLINDVYKLMPNKFIYIRSQPNEIDKTNYKFKIPSGATLQGWYKMDEGVTAEMQKERMALTKVPRPNRMKKNRSEYLKKNRK